MDSEEPTQAGMHHPGRDTDARRAMVLSSRPLAVAVGRYEPVERAVGGDKPIRVQCRRVRSARPRVAEVGCYQEMSELTRPGPKSTVSIKI